MKRIDSFFLFAAMLVAMVCFNVSCSDDDKTPEWTGVPIKAVVVNEGQFTKANSSLSALTTDNKILNDVFKTANDERPIGDVAESLSCINGYYFVAVNNSGKVEVLDPATFASVATIKFDVKTSPRFVAAISESEAIVSDQGAQIVKINTQTYEVVEHIQIEGQIEHMLKVGSKLFCANYSKGVQVYDVTDMKAPRTIEGGVKPYQSSILILDKNGKLWAFGESKLCCIDPTTEKVVKTISVPEEISLSWYPRIATDGTAGELYFDGKKDNKNYIFTLDVEKSAVDAEPYLELVGLGMIYGMNVSAEGNVFVCDCLDYSAQRGFLREYRPDGSIFSFRVGIYPCMVYFTDK